MGNSKEYSNSKTNFIFIGESYLGGMAGSKRIQNIINGLLKQKEVSISNLIIENPNDSKSEIINGVKNSVIFHKIRYKLTNPFTFIFYFIKGFNFILKMKKVKNLNVIYCYDSPTILVLPFLLFAKIIGFKVLIDLVEDYNLLNKSNFNLTQKLKLKIYAFLEKKIFSYADGVICISKYLIEKFTRENAKLLYIPINVNFELFKNQIRINNDKIQLFYGGSFGEKDGLTYLLQSFENVIEKYPNIELVLSGKPPKNGMKEILDFIDKSTFKNSIKFLGYLDDETYYTILNSSDILCMTRVDSLFANAGFPFKLGEMLATGKPVVATNVGDVSNFIVNKKNALLIEPESIMAISDAIEYIINNKLICQEMAVEGRKTAEKYFDVDVHAISILNFVNSL